MNAKREIAVAQLEAVVGGFMTPAQKTARLRQALGVEDRLNTLIDRRELRQDREFDRNDPHNVR